MPAVPPYSSMTTARWWPSRRISESAASTRLLAGSRFTSRTSSRTLEIGSSSGRSVRSRRCTKPITSSWSPSMTGKRECRAARASRTARDTDRLALRKTTSVRGTISSRTCRVPVLAAISRRNSASLIRLAVAVAVPPINRAANRARNPANRLSSRARA